MSDLVKLTIDGHEVEVPKGTLIVEAARKLGEEIPVYCYHPQMEPVGACRACVVEVEGQRRPMMPACTTQVNEGMVVHTNSPNAVKAREGVLEFLLINHPLDCPVCDRAGECDLQDFAFRYGRGESRFVEAKRHFSKAVPIGKNIILDRERCIMCQRCARFSSEIAQEDGLTILERGNRAMIGTFDDKPYDSIYSGNTVELCPVGALTAKSYRFAGRPWELQQFSGVCHGCSVGCNVTYDVRYDKVARIRSRRNPAIDNGWLCDRARYDMLGLTYPENRVVEVQEKEGSEWRSLDPQEALSDLAKLAKQSDKIAIIAHGSTDNETLLAWQRLGREVLDTPDLVHPCGFLGNEEHPLKAFGQIEGLEKADAIIVAGLDIERSHAILELRLRQAAKKGVKVVALGQEHRFADYTVKDLGEGLKAISALKLPEENSDSVVRPQPRSWEGGGATSDDLDRLSQESKGWEKLIFIFDEKGLGLEEYILLEKALDSREESQQAPFGLLLAHRQANGRAMRILGYHPKGPQSFQKELIKEAWGKKTNLSEGKSYQEVMEGEYDLVISLGELPQRSPDWDNVVVFSSTRRREGSQGADLFFPLTAATESEHTLISTDGSLQLSRQALPPVSESLPGWRWARSFAMALESLWQESSASEWFENLSLLNPIFEELGYKDFEVKKQDHWSYPQSGKLGTPRPDLSAMPSQSYQSGPWTYTQSTGSRVERAARIRQGDQPPSVPGQDDPRVMFERLVLRKFTPEEETTTPQLEREGYLPLRLVSSQGPQPPGPSPAYRHHQIGLKPREESKVLAVQSYPLLATNGSQSQESDEEQEKGEA